MDTNAYLDASLKLKYDALRFCSMFLRIFSCVIVFYIPALTDNSNPYRFSVWFLALSLIALSVHLSQKSHKYKQKKNKEESSL